MSSTSGASLTPNITINDKQAVLDSGNLNGLNPQEHRKLGRTASGGFKTTDGTIYVSKPFRSSTGKKLRAMVTFAPRQSHFDTNNAQSGMNEFRGFFTLFWMSIFIFMVGTYIRSFETTGSILNLQFATMFSDDAITLALSDAVLVGSTFICVPFAKMLSKGWVKYYWTGVILQHTWQTLVLLVTVSWTFHRHWPWVQSGFLTLHCLVMLMKMHSYIAVNGSMQSASTLANDLLEKLRQATANEGWDAAVSNAKAHTLPSSTVSGATTPGTDSETLPQISGNGTTKTVMDASTADSLRKRLLTAVASSGRSTPDIDTVRLPGMSKAVDSKNSTPGNMIEDRLSSDVRTLANHPDPVVSAIAKDWDELDSELGTGSVCWPNNVTFHNFAVYQLIPTLVYELEYPRTDKYEKFNSILFSIYLIWCPTGFGLCTFLRRLAFFGTFALLYSITETFILPKTPTAQDSFFRALLDLAIPFMIAYLLLFYIIFECICNAFAEISYFADRQFYEDWWNSTSWDEFSRKWNKPVHSFLLRHVYTSTVTHYKMSRTSATFLTFLLSACAHELVMAVVTKKFRFYLFFMQLIQIPLIALSRIPAIKSNKLLGNIVFWLGLYAGFPLLCVSYVAH